MKNFIILVTLLSFISSASLVAQISFADGANKIAGLESMSGAPMAVADTDGDGLDDIISLDRSRDLIISYQNADGTFDIVDFPAVGTSNWGMTIGDVANDGTSEIFTGGAYNQVRLVATERNGNNTVAFMDGPSIFVQAVSFFDINNDGSLDAIACHDDGPVGVYVNDGNGNLSYDNNTPIKKFNDEEMNSGNYGNVWTDVNGDGLTDYYIAKCRQAVTSMTDVRRINQLWINNGDGTFTESAAAYGLNIGFQSWTAEFQDIDNDGDMDCLITNHDGPTQLFENINNTNFVDVTAQSGIEISGIPIQAAMKDFDNDGFVDVFVTGSDGALFRNNGDKTFTKIENSSSNLLGDENSFAVGDLNHDGFLDLMIGYGTGFNGPSSSDEDKMWLNSTNGNHWLAVQLEGTQSNRGGVGSRIEIFGDWGMMVREVRAGESYGTSHTLTQHFGIGASTEIDSIVVKWPSGVIDLHENVIVDQFVTLLENNCITPPSAITADGPTTICNGDEVTLTAAPGFEYLWSNGAITQSITVSDEGVYTVEVMDGSACSATSTAINVIVDPEETFVISANQDLILCEGESIIISTANGEIVEWFDGSFGQTIEITAAAVVQGFTQGTCTSISSNSLSVEFIPTPEEPSNVEFDFEFNQVTLTADGNGIQWYNDEFGVDLLGTGNELILDDVMGNRTVYVANVSDTEGGIESVGEETHLGDSDYNSENFNGAMVFDVFDEVMIRTIAVDTDMAGIRNIQLLDPNGNLLYEKEVDIEVGQSEVRLNFAVPAGVGYMLTTAGEQNFETFGFQSPRLKRSAVDFGANLNFPYVVDDLISIRTSNFGSGFYYYFYDWKVSADSKACISEILPVDIVPNSVLNISDSVDIDLFPNPSNGVFQVNYAGVGSFDIRVLSLDGKEQVTANNLSHSHQINLTNYASGLYIMEMKIGEDVFYGKLIKF